MSIFGGIEDNLDDHFSEYRRLLKRKQHHDRLNSAAINISRSTTSTSILLTSALIHQRSCQLNSKQPSFSEAKHAFYQLRSIKICSTFKSNIRQIFRNQLVFAAYRLNQPISRHRHTSTPELTLRQFAPSTITLTSGLPKIKIEKYDGDQFKWNMWYGLLFGFSTNSAIFCKCSSGKRTTVWKTRHNCQPVHLQTATTLHPLRHIIAIVCGVFHLLFPILRKRFRHLDSRTTWTPPFTCSLQPTNFNHRSERLQWDPIHHQQQHSAA